MAPAAGFALIFQGPSLEWRKKKWKQSHSRRPRHPENAHTAGSPQPHPSSLGVSVQTSCCLSYKSSEISEINLCMYIKAHTFLSPLETRKSDLMQYLTGTARAKGNTAVRAQLGALIAEACPFCIHWGHRGTGSGHSAGWLRRWLHTKSLGCICGNGVSDWHESPALALTWLSPIHCGHLRNDPADRSYHSKKSFYRD